jgi:hypothetical protein
MRLDTAVRGKLFVPEPDRKGFGKLVDGQTVSLSEFAYLEPGSALPGNDRRTAPTPPGLARRAAGRRLLHRSRKSFPPCDEGQALTTLAAHRKTGTR